MKKIHIRYYVSAILISIILTGCQIAEFNYEQEKMSDNMTQVSETEALQTETLEIEASETETSEIEASETQDVQETVSSQSFNKSLSYEQLDAYQQMTLFIQEGFRIYNVEGAYQAYFGKIYEGENLNSCEILLEDEEYSWLENISYTYDAEKNWYTFNGQYEPVLTGNDTFWNTDRDSEFAINMKNNYLYTALISQTIDIAAPAHYYAESGPSENDVTMYFSYSNDEPDSYYIRQVIYTYNDERLDLNITIEYPKIYYDNDKIEAAINEKLRKAFFYGYGSDSDSDEDAILVPQHEMYTTIQRQYSITRQDDDYLSIRIYEYNDVRGANHPNEWETGITINMQTGEVLTLEDVVGSEWTPKTLLESGAFKSLWHWENETDESWVTDMLQYSFLDKRTLNDYDKYFYLTDDALGLVTSMSRYYTCMEAKFEDLDIEWF